MPLAKTIISISLNHKMCSRLIEMQVYQEVFIGTESDPDICYYP